MTREYNNSLNNYGNKNFNFVNYIFSGDHSRICCPWKPFFICTFTKGKYGNTTIFLDKIYLVNSKNKFQLAPDYLQKHHMIYLFGDHILGNRLSNQKYLVFYCDKKNIKFGNINEDKFAKDDELDIYENKSTKGDDEELELIE